MIELSKNIPQRKAEVPNSVKPQLDQQVQRIQEVKEETTKPQKLDKDVDLKKLVKSLNDLPIFRDKLQFGFSEEIGQSLVQITDRKTKELIRQYPTEEFINRMMYYRDNIGSLFDESA